MADDARISTALPRHPKTVKLQRRLGTSGCWSLICLFLWVADNHPDGDLQGMTAEDIEIAASWSETPGDLVRTLAEVRFLDGQEGAYKVHDWAEHNPWAATRPQRIESAQKAAAARWKKEQTADAQRMRPACDPDATRMRSGRDPHETAMPSSPLLSSPPDTTVKPSSELCSSDPIEPTRSPKKRETKPPTDKAVRLATKLHEEILKNKPDFHFSESWLNSWARTADLMMTRDHRSAERISALIGWTQGDPFWRSNVLSMDRLREKFDELEMKARSQYEAKTNHGNGKPSIAEVIERETAICRARAH